MKLTSDAEQHKTTWMALLAERLDGLIEKEDALIAAALHLNSTAEAEGLAEVDGPTMKRLLEKIGDVDSLSDVLDGPAAEQLSNDDLNRRTNGSRAFFTRWEGECQGRTIRIENKWSMLLFSSAYMYIDDKLVDQRKSWMHEFGTLLPKDHFCIMRATMKTRYDAELVVRAGLAWRNKAEGVTCGVRINDVVVPMDKLRR